jgi:uncharacterized protein
MLQHVPRVLWVAVFPMLLLFSTVAVGAAIRPPEEGHFVVDLAKLLDPENVASLNAICNKSQIQRDVPIYVVTIESIATQGAQDTSIESFAWELFEQWGLDPAFMSSSNWRHGLLFLVSKDDRKARIELGMDWDSSFNARSAEIMKEIIVPAFKEGDYASGIAAGVGALETMDPSQPPTATSARRVADTSPLTGFFWMSALMIAGFALLYGFLVFVASKVSLGDSHFIERAASDRAKQRRANPAEYTPLIVPGIDPNSTTYTSPSSDYYDSGSSSISSTDSGGSFSDGGGASGSW